MNNHHFLLPAEHYTRSVDRMTRTEDFVPIWTYKKKKSKWVSVVAFLLVLGAIALYFYPGAK